MEKWFAFDGKVTTANPADVVARVEGECTNPSSDCVRCARTRLLAAAPALAAALEYMMCEVCHFRIGWNERFTGTDAALDRTDWASCFFCRDARAALKAAKGG